MNSIRKLMAVGTGAGALGVIVAFALAPVTVLAEGPHHWELWRGFGQSAKTTMPTAVTLSAACSAAVQTIKTAFADDRAEDTAERKNAALTGAAPAADVDEDKTERAAAKALWVAARDACAPQLATKTAPAAPTAACTAAKQAVKDAWLRKDYAALRSLWSSVKTACGFSTDNAFAFEHR
jgi:hypothetical protein